MNVVHLLHQHVLAKNEEDIGFVPPKRVTVIPFPLLVLQLSQRLFVSLQLQIFDNAMSNTTFEKPEYFRRLVTIVRQQMQVVWHQDIGQKQETARVAGLINGFASKPANRIGPEHWKPIFGHSRDVKTGAISRDAEFLLDHHSQALGGAQDLPKIRESQRLSAHLAAEPHPREPR